MMKRDILVIALIDLELLLPSIYIQMKEDINLD